MLESIASFIINVISTLGYPGILLMMAIESALIPLPSEIIMPFSGYLAATGRFNLGLVILMGAIGNTAGSLVAYYLGYWGHEKVVRRLVRKYGKYILFTEDELDQAEMWMKKYRNLAVFGARVLPGVRTIISLPAGIFKLPVRNFLICTFLGSLLWSTLLAYIGYSLGGNWKNIEHYFRPFEGVVILVIVGLVGWYIYHKLSSKKAK